MEEERFMISCYGDTPMQMKYRNFRFLLSFSYPNIDPPIHIKVKYNVPNMSIIQTIKGSRFTEEDIQCLKNYGVPTEIINQAKSQKVR